MHPDNLLYIPKRGNGYVYHLVINGKDYIGISTTPFSVRWNRHKAPDSNCTKVVRELNLLRKLNKWLKIHALIIKLASNLRLDRLLKFYIKKYASYKGINGLNSTPGGRLTVPVIRKSRKKTKSRTQPKWTWQELGMT